MVTANEMYHFCHLSYHRLTTNVPGSDRRLPNLIMPWSRSWETWIYNDWGGRATDTWTRNFTPSGRHDNLGGKSQHIMLVSWLGTHACGRLGVKLSTRTCRFVVHLLNSLTPHLSCRRSVLVNQVGIVWYNLWQSLVQSMAKVVHYRGSNQGWNFNGILCNKVMPIAFWFLGKLSDIGNSISWITKTRNNGSLTNYLKMEFQNPWITIHKNNLLFSRVMLICM